MFKKIIFSVIFSQCLLLGVFWAAWDTYYVVEKEKNLCWEFTRWDAVNTNWLPKWWEAVFLDNTLDTEFFSDINCEQWNSATCCKNRGFRYAGVPIWVSYVSDERAWAEFLASKKIINVKSFNPDQYKLEETITRKEVMKVISWIGRFEVNDTCTWIYADVHDDWGCKYIEKALELGYISWNEWFRPNDTLTRSEALKLIFKARGIPKKYETSSWQEDYISSAYYLWYIDEKFSDYNMAATRWWIFSVAAKSYDDFSNE